MPHIQKVGEQFQAFWTNMIVGQQRDVMISAAATAVGINMTFLLPYSMLRKGWDKYFRGLAIFDLSTGLFIPFILATGCVVIASSSQFHGQPAGGFVAAEPGGEITGEPAKNLVGPYKGLLANRLKFQIGEEEFEEPRRSLQGTSCKQTQIPNRRGGIRQAYSRTGAGEIRSPAVGGQEDGCDVSQTRRL